MRWVLAWLVLIGPLFWTTSSHASERRVALVIGNGAYQTGPLRNPVNDAQDMSIRLRNLGFEVTERTNLRTRQIGGTLRELRNRLSAGSVALVFYAGHGVQIKGENYLPAVDAVIEGEEDVPNQSLSVRQIMDVLADAGTRLNLVFLDSCRDNPYQRSFRSATRGLSRENVPSGTLMSFATRPGGVADDGAGRNGVYTSALLRAMTVVDQPIELVLKNVVTMVKAETRNRQEPWIEGSISGDFCFGACASGERPVASAAAPGVSGGSVLSAEQIENQFWTDARSIGNREAYEAYLAQYPRGRFAALARAALIRFSEAPGAAGTAGARPGGPVMTGSAPMFPGSIPVATPGAVFKDCDACPEMVAIPGGSFLMGSPPGQGHADERPQRWVTIAAFALGRTEVTQAQWFAVMGTRPSRFQGDDLPVEQVSWDDAQDFVRRLSTMTGRRYRLPSEAEWEYAARAGSQGRTRLVTMRCSWAVMRGLSRTPVVGRSPLVASRPTLLGSMTCRAMSGSGWRTAGMGAMLGRLPMGARGGTAIVVGGSCAVGPGSSIKHTCARPTATGTPRRAATVTAASASPGRIES